MARRYKRLRYEDRRTIEKMLKAGDSIVEIAAAVGTHRDATIGFINEYGTSKKAARPYMTVANNKAHSKVVEAQREVCWLLIC